MNALYSTPSSCIYHSFMILLKCYESLQQRVSWQIPDTLTGDLRLRDAAHAGALAAVELSESRAAPRFTARALCARRSGQDAQHERQAHIHPALQKKKKKTTHKENNAHA